MIELIWHRELIWGVVFIVVSLIAICIIMHDAFKVLNWYVYERLHDPKFYHNENYVNWETKRNEFILKIIDVVFIMTLNVLIMLYLSLKHF